MKVLIADDSEVLRAAVIKLLEPEGYEVATAENGVEAIKRFYEEKPDLVLLDITMPQLNGYVVCRLIKQDPAAAHVPVMILTGRSAAEDRYWGVKSGADGYLTKDSLGEELVSAIKSTLASRALRELSGNEELSPPPEHEGDVLGRVCEMLDRQLFEATIVNEITSVATRPVGLVGTIDEILTSLARLIYFDAAAIVLAGEGRTELHSRGPIHDDDVAAFQELCAEHMHEVSAGVVMPAEIRVTIHDDNGGEEGEASAMGWSSFHTVPLRSRGTLFGMLVLGSHSAGGFTDAVHRTLRTITPSLVSVLGSAQDFQAKLADEALATFSSLA